MILATSDLHGFPLERFLRMLDKAGFRDTDQLYVIGDVIDRNGDGGVAALRWMMEQRNVTLIRGNHEAMMLDCDFLFGEGDGELTARQEHALLLWHRNGGMVTIGSLTRLKETEPEVFAALMDYVRSAPLYMELAVPMKRFVLVHGGLNGFRPDRTLDDYGAEDLVWTRPGLENRYWEDRMVILGHTPTQFYDYSLKGSMLRTDTWADIDTGAAGGGSPMLLRLDDMCPFYEE